MNKQQLAAKIWESANQMRSKIEANEYKDYILGFIFYKYLSEQEIKFAKKEGFTNDDIITLSEEDEETTEYFKKNIGYFIAYKDLFATWLSMGKDFDVSNVRDALSAFSRMIYPRYKKLFQNIFHTLETGLSKLGDSSGAQTKSINNLLQLIKDIPMDGRQDYDVLGFIYEYLIEKFAANAGKKAGEFYTPHEVSLLMSEIVAYHLKDKTEIQIYDPTSGSGSLLITIGNSVKKYISNKNKIKYYAQELKENTYNLTRMNLVMRNISVDNIETRNADTLESDWPFFDENDPVNTYNPLYVDAVVSNPPYSQKWDSTNKEADPRYARFGLAPKSKADYAFMLHDLFHVKPDGIMAIVLPHGVLFRSGEEGTIRKNLIEANHIDTIIGLPANIFFGTGIPTIIMVLKQKRQNTDILIIDASKGFIKDGKNNKLRASDIKRISDTFAARIAIPKFSKVVTRDDIRANDYNLNIPRYVDSSDNTESWDIYASMFGGIPNKEIDEIGKYWETFTGLCDELFTNNGTPFSELKVENIKTAINEHHSVVNFVSDFNSAFESFGEILKTELLTNMMTVEISKEETVLSAEIFERIQKFTLIDKYEAYQLFYDKWVKIEGDLETIQSDGFEATRMVDPNMVIKKKDGKDVEAQDGWVGRIMPFELVQETYLQKELQSIKKKEGKLLEIATEIDEIIDAIPEDEKEADFLNESKDAFVLAELSKAIKDAYANLETEEIKTLSGYIALIDKNVTKEEKENFVKVNNQVEWKKFQVNLDGTFEKKIITKRIDYIRSNYIFPEDSIEAKLISAEKLLNEEKELKKKINKEKADLHLLTKKTIENLTDAQVYELLELKWIKPLTTSLEKLPEAVINNLAIQVQALSVKYNSTYKSVMEEIHETENSLADMIDQLTGSEFDMKGLEEFRDLLKGL